MGRRSQAGRLLGGKAQRWVLCPVLCEGPPSPLDHSCTFQKGGLPVLGQLWRRMGVANEVRGRGRPQMPWRVWLCMATAGRAQKEESL